jgi:hypothetical protein
MQCWCKFFLDEGQRFFSLGNTTLGYKLTFAACLDHATSPQWDTL